MVPETEQRESRSISGGEVLHIAQPIQQKWRGENSDILHMLTLKNTGVTNSKLCVISGFRRKVFEICPLLGHYAVYSGNSLPTFRDNISVPSSSVKKSKKARFSSWISYP